MATIRTRPLTRQQIGQFIGSERGVRAFEDAQADLIDQNEAITSASFLTLTSEPSVGAERVFTPGTGLSGNDGGPNSTYTLGLSDTAVTAGSYGDASHFVSITFDAKGRATAASSVAANTTNITEGAKLFYTDARARSALTNGTGISYTAASGTIALDTASNRNVDHSAVHVNTGTGLTGGGDLTTDRTIALANTSVAAGTYSPVNSITVDAQGRITAIS